MSNIDNLKQELIKQKTAIESKGGSVSVANTHPSPSEITAGINTIQDLGSINFSLTTASTLDVANGKQFYNSNGTLATGKLELPNFLLTTATTTDVVSGKAFYSDTGKLTTGTLTLPDFSETDAEVGDVAEGKKFYNSDGELVTGTKAPTNFSATTALTSDVLSGKKFYSNTGELSTGELELTDFTKTTAVSADVVKGKKFYSNSGELTTGGLELTDFSLATATKDDVASGKTFYNSNGELTEGEMENADFDFSLTTATQSDVTSGKQFYSADGTLTTGTKVDVDLSNTTATASDVISGKSFYDASGNFVSGSYDEINSEFFVYNPYKSDVFKTDEYTNVTIPSHITEIKPYLFYASPKNFKIWLHSGITRINDYAFHNFYRTQIMNFEVLTQLTTVAARGFGSVKIEGEVNFPDTITTVGDYAFSWMLAYASSVSLPKNITKATTGLFTQGPIYPRFDNFEFPSTWTFTEYPEYFIAGIIANCDLVIKEGVTSLGTAFNQYGGFNNVVLPSTLTNMGFYPFYSVNKPSGGFHSITFNSVNPPVVKNPHLPFFSSKQKDAFVYVPDQSVQEYSAIKPFSGLKVTPISEKV